MSGLDGFWAVVAAQLDELRSAASADDVLRTLARERDPYGPDHNVGPDGFFAGDGDELMGALYTAGWSIAWAEASYHFAMRAPNGDAITYVEGDVFRGDSRPTPHND